MHATPRNKYFRLGLMSGLVVVLIISSTALLVIATQQGNAGHSELAAVIWIGFGLAMLSMIWASLSVGSLASEILIGKLGKQLPPR